MCLWICLWHHDRPLCVRPRTPRRPTHVCRGVCSGCLRSSTGHPSPEPPRLLRHRPRSKGGSVPGCSVLGARRAGVGVARVSVRAVPPSGAGKGAGPWCAPVRDGRPWRGSPTAHTIIFRTPPRPRTVVGGPTLRPPPAPRSGAAATGAPPLGCRSATASPVYSEKADSVAARTVPVPGPVSRSPTARGWVGSGRSRVDRAAVVGVTETTPPATGPPLLVHGSPEGLSGGPPSARRPRGPPGPSAAVVPTAGSRTEPRENCLCETEFVSATETHEPWTTDWRPVSGVDVVDGSRGRTRPF